MKYAVGIVVALFLALILSPFTIVDAQERAVVTRLGSISRVLEDGIHYVTPLVEDVHKMPISLQSYESVESSYSKDGQTVDVSVTLNYQLDPTNVGELFKKVRSDYEVVIIKPAVKEAVKSVTSNYTAQGLLDNRAKVKEEIGGVLSKRLAENYILTTELSVTNLDFDDAYEQAIKAKQIEEQNALKQANVTKQEEEKKKQEILKAEALAEKTRLEVQALQASQGKQIIEKIYAEAALEAAKKWNGALPTQMVPGGAVPFLQLK